MSQWDSLALNLKFPSVFQRPSFLLSWMRLRVLSFLPTSPGKVKALFLCGEVQLWQLA